jgi:hypothetical protein
LPKSTSCIKLTLTKKVRLIKNDKVVVYGGTSSSEESIQQGTLKILNDLYIFNIKQRLWEEPLLGGNYPPPKLHYTFSVNFPQVNNFSGEIILLGGTDEPSKQKVLEMKMYILSQTEGQNWKVEEQERDFEGMIMSPEDDDDDMNPSPQIHPVHLTDKEILEEEYGRAETLIQKLKEEVSEMEINLKQERLKNAQLKENSIKNAEKAKIMDAECRLYSQQRDADIKELTIRKTCNQTIINNLLESLALKVKQRKLLQARIMVLEQAMDSAEEFIVHLDRFFSDAIQSSPSFT